MRLTRTQRFATRAAASQRRRVSAVERVASGLRVRRAADDAAGLGVATNLETRSLSSKMALRNISTAQDIIQTAESGSREILELLQRMRELAMASASETLDDDERQYIGDEYDALLNEINRISTSTTWDGRPLLTGSQADIFLAYTPIAGAMPVADIASAFTQWVEEMADEGYSVALGLGFVGNGASGDASDSAVLLTDIGAAGFATALNSLAGATATGINIDAAVGQFVGADTWGTDVSGGVDADQLTWRGGSESRSVVTVQSGNPTGGALFGTAPATIATSVAVTDFTNAQTPEIDVHRVGASSNNGLASLSGAILYNGTVDSTLLDGFLDELRLDVIDDLGDAFGAAHVGPGNTANDRINFLSDESLALAGLGLTASSVDTQADALEALEDLDGAIDTVNAFHADLGAGYNRLESAFGALSDHIVALDASHSTIMDADMAEAVSELTMEDILAQSTMAALAQAQRLDMAAVQQLVGGAG